MKRQRALPQVESTMLVEGINKKAIKCVARQSFTVGNSSVRKGETFFLIASSRRENRYYIVHFSTERSTYQCSCGANCCDHEHLKVVRGIVLEQVKKAQHVETPAQPVEPPKVTDIGTRGALNGNRGFSLLKQAV